MHRSRGGGFEAKGARGKCREKGAWMLPAAPVAGLELENREVLQRKANPPLSVNSSSRKGALFFLTNASQPGWGIRSEGRARQVPRKGSMDAPGSTRSRVVHRHPELDSGSHLYGGC